jgi:hypothetical protein
MDHVGHNNINFSKLDLGDSMWDCGYGLTEDRGIIDHRIHQW